QLEMCPAPHWSGDVSVLALFLDLARARVLARERREHRPLRAHGAVEIDRAVAAEDEALALLAVAHHPHALLAVLDPGGLAEALHDLRGRGVGRGFVRGERERVLQVGRA